MNAVVSLASRLPDAEFQHLIQRAKERHVLSEIVGRHTALKPRGNSEKVGLCPFHSERTPSFEVNDAKGRFYCHGCGKGGDAFTFLVDREGMTFRQAYETLAGDEFPVISDDERAKRRAEDDLAMAERVELARSIWRSACPTKGTPAEVYARTRGITIDLPRSVRFAMTPRWRNPETGECGRDHPAMVCALQDNSDEIVGVQCIFLQDGGRAKYSKVRADGTPAKAKLTFGKLAGAALRLAPAADRIVLCEGPEDGLTLLQTLPGQTVWSTCGTAGLPKLKFPPVVHSITLAGDNNDAGRKACGQARHVYAARGLSVQEVYPNAPFKDWNDELRGVKA